MHLHCVPAYYMIHDMCKGAESDCLHGCTLSSIPQLRDSQIEQQIKYAPALCASVLHDTQN